MPEQLTLEKLKIHERLTVLETRFDALESKIDENVNKLNHIIIGNGDPGLSETVRGLVNKEKERELLSRLTLGSVITLGVKAIWDTVIK